MLQTQELDFNTEMFLSIEWMNDKNGTGFSDSVVKIGKLMKKYIEKR